MRLFEQLDFFAGEFLRNFKSPLPAQPPPLEERCGRDSELEAQACQLLRAAHADPLVPALRVEWNPRMRSAAGRADFHHHRVSLNPRLRDVGPAEIDRTLRHELAHLLAHFRAGRRQISPHGREWRQACVDLGIGDEKRCHALPFPSRTGVRRYLYRCPKCAAGFPRVRQIKHAVACLACCRRYNRGAFARRFQLRLVRSARSA